MSIDTLKLARTMEAAGMPKPQSEALATVLRENVITDLVTNHDLGTAVDRLEGHVDTKIEREVNRLDHKIDLVVSDIKGDIKRLDDKIEAAVVRMEATMWKAAFAMLGGGLAIGGLLIRFVR